HGGTYTIIPDQIEAGTYMVAAAATGGEVLVKNVIPKHLECISAKLRETGTIVQEFEDSVLVKGISHIRRVNIKTMPYPGFPTDMQPQMGTLLCLANGTSVIIEGIYDNRFKYVNELRKMGAEIQVDGRIAIIEGGRRLTGAQVMACDLRAGAAMVIAGLCAAGTTLVEDVHYIERGYEDFVGKLQRLGADISLVEIPEATENCEKIISIV
ncbi:MAG: UDP-N-acetylglucosamine 1-carboxyvinyltransferase, partial [Oscillospiraceae bacterium]|nr:UDP-N-acetylglucosamine 1-carboxyvinyltransferase [Oscillospiraceae bacterium]